MSIVQSPPQVSRNNCWYHFNQSDTVYVFVHGVLSDSRRCWQTESKDGQPGRYWPELVTSDGRLGNPSVFLGGYYSALDSGDFDIHDSAQELIEGLTVADSKFGVAPISRGRLIFICHSTGGIVVRHMLERFTDNFASKQLGLLLYASPSLGSIWANIISAFAVYYNQKQVRQLKWKGASLLDIHNRFKDLVYDRKLPGLVGREACETQMIYRDKIPTHLRRVIPSRWKVVDTISAGQYFGAPRKIAETNHFTIVKPTDLEHRSHRFLVDFRSEFEATCATQSMPSLVYTPSQQQRPQPPRSSLSAFPRLSRQALVGRDDLLEKICRRVDMERAAPVVLYGSRGAGKTALAMCIADIWSNQSESWTSRYQRLIWTSAMSNRLRMDANAAESDIQRFYNAATHALGVSRGQAGTTEEQWSSIFSAMSQMPALVILDDFDIFHADVGDAPLHAGLLSVVESMPQGSCVLVTSPIRPRPSSLLYTLEVPPLTPDLSRHLLGVLCSSAEIDIADDAAAKILNFAGGLPLLIEYGVGSPNLLSNGHHSKDIVTRILGDIASSDSTTAQALVLLAYLRRGITAASTARYLSIEADLACTALNALEKRLIAKSISVNKEARWSLHGLPAEIVLSSAWNPSVVSSVGLTLRKWACDFVSVRSDWEFHAQNREDLSAELDTLKLATELSIASRDRISIATLTAPTAHLLHIEGRWRESECILVNAIQSCGALVDAAAKAEIRILLGRHYAHLRKTQEAEVVLNAALEDADRAGRIGLRAEALMRIGHAVLHSNPRQSIDKLSMAIVEAKAASRPRTIVSAVGYLVDAYIQLGQYRDALQCIEQHIDDVTAIEWERARVYHGNFKADALVRLGLPEHASPLYTESITLGQAWGDKRLLSLAYLGLAECNNDMAMLGTSLKLLTDLGMDREKKRGQDLFRNMQARTALPPLVLIVGPPASGKSTIRKALVMSLSRDHDNISSWSIDDIHREISNTRPSWYLFSEDGSYVILDRRKTIAEATRMFMERMRYSRESACTVAEISHEDYTTALAAVNNYTLAGATVIVADAPVQIRLDRNASRGHDHVPPEVVASYPSEIPDGLLYSLFTRGAHIRRLDTYRPVAEVLADVATLAGLLYKV